MNKEDIVYAASRALYVAVVDGLVLDDDVGPLRHAGVVCLVSAFGAYRNVTHLVVMATCLSKPYLSSASSSPGLSRASGCVLQHHSFVPVAFVDM